MSCTTQESVGRIHSRHILAVQLQRIRWVDGSGTWFYPTRNPRRASPVMEKVTLLVLAPRVIL